MNCGFNVELAVGKNSSEAQTFFYINLREIVNIANQSVWRWGPVRAITADTKTLLSGGVKGLRYSTSSYWMLCVRSQHFNRSDFSPQRRSN